MNWVTTEINGQEVSIAFDENSIHIYNAFPIKDDLKSRGYRWDPADKSWFIKPTNLHSEIEILKNNLSSPSKAVQLESKDSQKSLSPFPTSLSVAELRNRLDKLIKEGIRGTLWIRGVVASDVKNYSWMSYFDLKDEDESKDIFFRVEIKKNFVDKINKKLSDMGIAQFLSKDLPVFCQVEVYLPLRNVVDIRLSLLDILPEYTQSRLKNQREITLEKLKTEGILNNQKNLVVPNYISNIGLITSEQGTSITDIQAGLHPFASRYSFYFLDSRMEGANAVESIIQAIHFFENNPHINIDVLLIARGGGSEQSLSVFNDFRLCRSICLSPIPIITAIGHEKDISAIEQCSWLTPTPSTPSGIGKYLQNRYLLLQDQLSHSISRLIHYFITVHQGESQKIKALLKHIPIQISGFLKLREERFRALSRKLEQSVIFSVRHQEHRLSTLIIRFIKSSRDIRNRSTSDIHAASRYILLRMNALRRSGLNKVKNTVTKLDFQKQYRENLKRCQSFKTKTQSLLFRGSKVIDEAERILQSRTQVIRANEPRQILKKGFTLVFDDNRKVIKSIVDFNRKEHAVLEFHDGGASIVKANLKEDK